MASPWETDRAGVGRKPEDPLIIGLGASAGGLEPLEQFFASLPPSTGLVFVVVQHLEPRRPSLLAELLARHASMPVSEAAQGVRPEADHVYVIAPGTLLTLEDGAFQVIPAAEPSSHAPIDTFLRSLAVEQGERAAGILFSGAGHDGTVGLRAVKERGGLTLVQAPSTAKHDSMPESAIEAGLADHVLAPEQLASKILEHAGYVLSGGSSRTTVLDEQLAGRLGEICAAIRRHTGHDFESYKAATLMRRIRRRMQVLHVEEVAEYLQLIERDAVEAHSLVRDLLIGVTHFFRDPEAFDALARQVIPRVVQARAPDAPIRIWVAGCASGEEAYSIAILVREHLDRLGARRLVQLFATDLDGEMLSEARLGRYPLSIAEHVSPERLGRFFIREGEAYQAGKDLREMCIFSPHSVIRDPPFSQLDLLSCRNVLIYLNGELQKKLVPLFHYALRPGGFLFLGPSEGVAGSPELFETIDTRSRIFRRKETVVRPTVDFPLAARRAARSLPLPPSSSGGEAPPPTLRQRLGAAFEQMALGEYTAPCVVVNDRAEVVLVAGRTERFLRLPVGSMSSNLLEMIPASLRTDLRLAMRAASSAQRRVVRDNVAVELEDGIHRIRLTVRPVPGIEREAGLLAVVLQERSPLDRPDELEVLPGAAEQPAIETLELELRATRAELKTTVEDLESANEELKSSNEELISTNEELQSANEELQTSKEELQSLNEELETVNAELRQKVEELGAANGDLQNLFVSTEVATIFLDRDLRVARYTPAATRLFHLMERDVGRSIADLAPRFDGQDVVADAREVMRSLRPIERQVRTADGKSWFILRVLPYRTIENVIAGAVVTFVDVTELKRAEESLRESEERFRLLVEGVRDYAIFMLAPDGTVATWNAGAEQLNGYRAEEIVGQGFACFYTDEDVRSGIPQRTLEAAASQGRKEDEGWRVRKDGSRFWASALLTAVRDEKGELRGFANMTRDFTERKATEARLAYLASFPEKNPIPIVEADEAGRVKYANPAARRLFPDLAEKGTAHPWLAGWESLARELREGASAVSSRTVVVGDRSFLQSLAFIPTDRVIRVYGLDVTERVRAEQALRDSERLYRAIGESIDYGVWVCAPDGRNIYASQSFLDLVGITQEQCSNFGWGDVLHPDDAERTIAAWKECVSKQGNWDIEHRFRGVDGRWHPVLARGVPVRNEGGEIVAWAGINLDIGGLKQAEEALRASEAKYRTLFENMAEEVHYWQLVRDEAGAIQTWRLVDVNPPALKTWGRSSVDEIKGKTTDEIFGAGATAHYLPVVQKIMSEGVPYSFEDYFPNLDKHFRFTSVPLGDHFITTGADITRVKRAELDLRRSREGLSRLAEASLSVMAKTDLGEMLQALSEAALVLTGGRLATCGHGFVSGQYVVGGSARAVGAPACPPGDMFHLDRGGVHMALADGAEAIRLTDSDLRAHPRWWGLPQAHVPMRGLLGVRMLARSGQTSGMILVTDKEQGDFTEEDESLLKQLATVASLALQHVQARISLEEGDRSKNQFLAMLSHELRNPLAPIRNSLYVLERTPPGGEQARRAQTVIERQVDHLTRLVDDLLDVTRISRGKIQLHEESIDLTDVARRAVEDHRVLFTQNRLQLEVVIPDAPVRVPGDRVRLAQVIGNLLQNSAKFTKPGGTATLSLEANHGLGQAVITLRDTGVGIAADMLPRIFEPFTQADTTLDRSKGGLGLGLALVKGLVELHGGTVSAHSRGSGTGAEFMVRIPLEESVATTPPRRRSVRRDGPTRRVLVIEDILDAAESLRDVLKLRHHDVEVALSGAEGIEKARAFGPDVVLCDIGLPGMDGYEVARAMRADPALRAAKLVALTGYAAPEDVTRSREAGFDVHLAKPPSSERLDEVLADSEERDPPGQTGETDRG